MSISIVRLPGDGTPLYSFANKYTSTGPITVHEPLFWDAVLEKISALLPLIKEQDPIDL